MALKLEDLTLRPNGPIKSLLELVLERKEKNASIKKKRVLRPWESFSDSKEGRDFEESCSKEKRIMKPFVKEEQLTDEQKMALKIKKRASELFSHIKF